jgi:hypothetical protein
MALSVNKRRLAAAVRNVTYGVAVVAVCCGLVWVGIQIVKTNKPVTVAVSKTPHSFVWSDRVPLSNAMLKEWLAGRGAKFRAWAKLHPAAAKRLAKNNPSIVSR